ncbi:hypothetical protein [Caproicibacterium sp. BJN0003]|uniref:hypothetical protein n=1 Tax=Caproicibacterium sp. BJN0003 TaxID=2994078 RepID=UPI00224E3DA0|nr:hypothetical protein [Caproicibacterium sp. BJN0003]UZT82596.1 hypothetical protein OP489_01935 [Caproicibacterium sp. BJN0003]
MKEFFLYKAYGLLFSSEIPLPELQISEGHPDVSIQLGTVPEMVSDSSTVENQASRQEFLLHVNNVAFYYITNGNKIIIEPKGDYDEAGIRLFLLGSAFCALLQQRGYLVLHGSAVQIGGRGVLFTGTSGIGKSTLAAAFCEKGYQILTDDVCAVKIDKTGTPSVIPAFPGVKLWKDTAKWFDIDIRELEPVRRDIEKFRVGAGKNFLDRIVPLNGIYILNAADIQNIDIKEIKGLHRLEAIIENTYRYHFLQMQGVKSLHFQQCAAVADKVSVFTVMRPRSGFLLDELVSAIEGNVVYGNR